MKTVMITGAGGFLGRKLLERLTGRPNVRVTALTGQAERLRGRYPAERLRILGRRAILDDSTWSGGTDVLINCAFPRNADGARMADGLGYIADTLSAAVGGGVKAVINISSQSVYSQTRTVPADENTDLELETRYAVGKYAAELLTNRICADVPHTNLRLASLIGAGLEQRLVNRFVRQAERGEPIVIRGGTQQFGFLDVRDAAGALVRMLDSDTRGWEEVYNLGPARACTLLEIADCVAGLAEAYTGRKARVSVEEGGVWMNSSLNSERFYRQFSWAPAYCLEMTVRDIYQTAG